MKSFLAANTFQDVESLIVGSQREQIERFHWSYKELWSFSFVSHGEGQLEQIILDSASIASYVYDVVESSASS